MMKKAMVLLLAVCLLQGTALAEDAFTPSNKPKCGHENCYWTTTMDVTDTEKIWAMLQAPVTVIDGNQKTQYTLRAEPDRKAEAVGEITCASQSVHVLETLENGWSRVECYSSSFHDSKTEKWNALVEGYVETEKLKTVVPHAYMGLIVDKLTQRLYVFVEGELFSTLKVSTGLANERQPYNETRSGEFLLVSAVGDFKSDNLVCEKGIRFNFGDLIHTVPHVNRNGNKNYESFEALLGERASHGCIRVQRKRTPEGVNMTWIWNHYKKNTKLVIWEDWAGRTIPETPPETLVYYNEAGGRNYHSQETCYGVNKEKWPLTQIAYANLFTETYQNLIPCAYCAPPEKE